MQCIALAVFYFSIDIAGYRQCMDSAKLNEQGDQGELSAPAGVNFMLPGVLGYLA